MTTFSKLGISALLALAASQAPAAIDRNYYVAEPVGKTTFDVFNDGRNTYVQAIPGLVIRGATADGERYIVTGVPAAIPAELHGKAVTVLRGSPPPPPAPPKPDPRALLSRIEQLGAEIARLEQSVPPPAAAPAAAEEVWLVPHGASLRELLTQFAQRAGWALDISFNDVQTGQPRDLILSGGQKITGSFRTAIRETFSALPESSNIIAELRPDNNPPTLFIYRKGSLK